MMKTPEYATVKETAAAWGVSKRRVNMCIEDGRIPGVMKMGNMWLIPCSAKNPAGGRSAERAELVMADLTHIIAAIHRPVSRENLEAPAERASEPWLRLIQEGGIAYARGDFAQAISSFSQIKGNEAAKLCAASVAIAAAISMGNYPLFLEMESDLKRVIETHKDICAAAVSELALAGGYLGAMAPGMVPKWLKEGDFSALPQEIIPDASYKRTKYFQCLGDHKSALAVGQTALSFCSEEGKISFPGTYLQMLCAASCFSLDRKDEAKRYLLCAMHANLPHGFITPFVEYLPFLGGLIEELLEREYPAYLSAVLSKWQSSYANWLTFHNRFTKDNISLILSLQGYQIARLVAQGTPYTEIAAMFHISPGTLNNKMQVIYETLFITGRNRKTQLAKYVL